MNTRSPTTTSLRFNVTHTGALANAILASVLAAGCGSTMPDVPASTTVIDSAGTSIVVNRGVPTDTVDLRTARPMMAIGGGDATKPEEQFDRIGGAIRLSDGRIVILDDVNTRWFGADGEYLLTTTRQGAGPGEFRSAQSLIRLAGDSVVVAGGNYGDKKQVTFAPDGRFVREDRLDFLRLTSQGRLAEGVFDALPDRSWLVVTPVPDAQTDDRPSGLLRQFSRYTRVPSTLDVRYPMGLDGGIEQYKTNLDGRTNYVMHPLYSWSYYAAGGAPMRIAIGTNPEYSVEVWTPDGILERIVRRPDGRRAATPEVLAAAERLMRRNERSDSARTERILGSILIPDSSPAVGGLAVAADGSLLVRRDSWPPWDKTTAIDVFDPDGKFVRVLLLPGRFRVLDAGTDYILGVRYDDDDVPSIEVYRTPHG